MSPHQSHAPDTPDPAWQAVLAAMAAAGRAAGANAAAWWQQDTVGGRASGDTGAPARAILAGIADGDPLVLDALPAARLGEDGAEQAYEDDAGPASRDWRALDAALRAGAIDAWRDACQAAVLDEVPRHCRHALGLGEGDGGGGAEDDPRGDQ
jgi:hypothetical protein